MQPLLALALLCSTFIVATSAGGVSYCPYKPWGAWSSCSVSCGYGKEYRTRKCDKKDYCQCEYKQDDKEYRECYVSPVMYGPWKKKGKCDKNCKQKYKRSCKAKKGCDGYKRRELRKYCKKEPTKKTEKCPCCCKWLEWMDVDGCDMYKGKCMQDQTRECECKPDYCPKTCKGPDKQKIPCDDPKGCCECYWGYDWVKEGDCVPAKDKYHCHQKEVKVCTCKPQYCGECEGSQPMRYVDCYDGCCDCYWTPWVEGECEMIGKVCKKKLTRECKCNHKNCPKDCDGESMKYELCKPHECCECAYKTWYNVGDCYHTGGYPGKCIQNQEQKCECYPTYCPKDCKPPVPTKTVPCDDYKDCCECKWVDDKEPKRPCYRDRYGKCKAKLYRHCECNYPYCDDYCEGEDYTVVDCPGHYPVC